MPFDFHQTEPCELRDYPEWRRGRMQYGLWMVPVADEALLAYIERCRCELADLLHPAGPRQAHLTLFVCGFECERASLDDDFPRERLARQIAALQNIERDAFSLPLHGISSFSSAAYIAVADHPHLSCWRDALQAVSAEIRQSTYVPHITLGLYKRSISVQRLRQRLSQLPPCPSTLAVNELVYATYQAHNPRSRLEPHFTLALKSPAVMNNG